MLNVIYSVSERYLCNSSHFCTPPLWRPWTELQHIIKSFLSVFYQWGKTAAQKTQLAIQRSCHDTRLLNLDTILVQKKVIIDASFDTTAKRAKNKSPMHIKWDNFFFFFYINNSAGAEKVNEHIPTCL